jgi:hypothetical protein
VIGKTNPPGRYGERREEIARIAEIAKLEIEKQNLTTDEHGCYGFTWIEIEETIRHWQI